VHRFDGSLWIFQEWELPERPTADAHKHTRDNVPFDAQSTYHAHYPQHQLAVPPPRISLVAGRRSSLSSQVKARCVELSGVRLLNGGSGSGLAATQSHHSPRTANLLLRSEVSQRVLVLAGWRGGEERGRGSPERAVVRVD
jgi:hypothetical protein